MTIRTGHLPAQTTSAVAGAIWGPHLVEDSDRVRRWCAETLDVLACLALGELAVGIRLVRGTEALPVPRGRAGPGRAACRVRPGQPGRSGRPARGLRGGLAVHRAGRLHAGLPGLPAGPVPPGRR